MRRNFSPELDIILSICIRGENVQVPNEADWGEILRIVEGNRISPYFLEKLSVEIPNQKIAKKLNAVSRSYTFSNLWLAAEIIDINQMAANLGIPIHFYKGPVWSEWLYDDIKIRPSADLDLFVSTQDLFPLIEGLTQKGYSINPFHLSLLNATESVRSAFLKSDYHVPLNKTDPVGNTSSVVEAHWKIAYPRLCFDIDPVEFPLYSTTIDFSGHKIPILKNEYQLLMLMINHGGKEGWDRLRYLVDLKTYMDKFGKQTDWNLVLQLAEKKGLRRLFTDSLGILRETGYPWSEQYPNVKNTDIKTLKKTWLRLTPHLGNASWLYFRRSIESHDPSYRFHVIKAHIDFLTDFRLHRHKLKWYRKDDVSAT